MGREHADLSAGVWPGRKQAFPFRVPAGAAPGERAQGAGLGRSRLVHAHPRGWACLRVCSCEGGFPGGGGRGAQSWGWNSEEVTLGRKRGAQPDPHRQRPRHQPHPQGRAGDWPELPRTRPQEAGGRGVRPRQEMAMVFAGSRVLPWALPRFSVKKRGMWCACGCLCGMVAASGCVPHRAMQQDTRFLDLNTTATCRRVSARL